MMNKKMDLMELNKSELEQVNGGWAACFFIGISPDGKAEGNVFDGTPTIYCDYLGLCFGAGGAGI